MLKEPISGIKNEILHLKLGFPLTVTNSSTETPSSPSPLDGSKSSRKSWEFVHHLFLFMGDLVMKKQIQQKINGLKR